MDGEKMQFPIDIIPFQGTNSFISRVGWFYHQLKGARFSGARVRDFPSASPLWSNTNVHVSHAYEEITLILYVYTLSPSLGFQIHPGSDCDCVWAYTSVLQVKHQEKKTATDWTETIIRWSQITIRGEFPPIPHKINKVSLFVKGARCKMIYGVSKNLSWNYRSAKPMPQAVGSFHRRQVHLQLTFSWLERKGFGDVWRKQSERSRCLSPTWVFWLPRWSNMLW